MIVIPDSGSATLDVSQEPGETNAIQVSFGPDILVSGIFACVEGTSSPGQPGTPENPEGAPEVKGQVLARTGVGSGQLTVIGTAMLLGGAMLALGGLAQRRRFS